jgi:hypothetical protein
LNSGWDNDLLALELGELSDDGFDLDLLGFDVEELESMLLDEIIDDENIDDINIIDEIKEECEIKIICTDWNERELAVSRLGKKKISWIDIEAMLK